jgi:hypothetical protein
MDSGRLNCVFGMRIVWRGLRSLGQQWTSNPVEHRKFDHGLVHVGQDYYAKFCSHHIHNTLSFDRRISWLGDI